LTKKLKSPIIEWISRNNFKKIDVIYKIWLNLLGDWRASLQFWLTLFVPFSLLFWYIYLGGYYPNDAKVLQDRGWYQGLFLSRLGLIPYLIFSFFILIPVQELVFRKFFLDYFLKNFHEDYFWILNLIQATIYALTRVLYPYPLGIVISAFIFGLIYGFDYKNNRSIVVVSVFHFLVAVMATSLNLI